MLRELATVLADLHDGLQPALTESGAPIRLVDAELTLPVDIALVLQGGGCAMLADVARSAADSSWHDGTSRLHLGWGGISTEAFG
jgi:hypothetical protein